MDLIREVLSMIAVTARDVLPVAVFMLFFVRVVLKQKLVDTRGVFFGLGLVTIGLALLLLGVDKALFPVGRMMVRELAGAAAADTAGPAPHWLTSYYLVYAFAFCIAFAAAMAEPALLAIARRVNEISGGAISTLGLRLAAALGVAAGVALGCVRIVTGIPLHWSIGAIFLIIMLQTLFAPRAIVPLAYDSGGVSTTAVTVPVVAALGLGLAELMPSRNPLLDGFGLIAFACLCPVITVLAYAQAAALTERISSRRLSRADSGSANMEK
jgi:hypothetical protein